MSRAGRQGRAGRAAPGRGGVGADLDQPGRRVQARLRADPGHQGTGRRRAGPGTLYGALDRLERLGLIESLPADDRAPPLPHYRAGGSGSSRAPRFAGAGQRGRAAAAAAGRHLMDDPRGARLVEAALRCYPARWRWRHADEAAELAALLIRDGVPPRAIAWSYLAGAAREWLTPRPGRRLGTVACALLVAACSLGVSAALLASAGRPRRPARASRGVRRIARRRRGVRPPAGHYPGAGHGRSC